MCYCSRSEICVSEIRRRIRATMFSLSDIKQIQEKRNKLDTEHLGQCFGSPGLQLNPVFETLAMFNWSIHYQNSLCDIIRKSRIGPLWSKNHLFFAMIKVFVVFFCATFGLYLTFKWRSHLSQQSFIQSSSHYWLGLKARECKIGISYSWLKVKREHQAEMCRVFGNTGKV